MKVVFDRQKGQKSSMIIFVDFKAYMGWGKIPYQRYILKLTEVLYSYTLFVEVRFDQKSISLKGDLLLHSKESPSSK